MASNDEYQQQRIWDKEWIKQQSIPNYYHEQELIKLQILQVKVIENNEKER